MTFLHSVLHSQFAFVVAISSVEEDVLEGEILRPVEYFQKYKFNPLKHAVKRNSVLYINNETIKQYVNEMFHLNV